jgi:transcriptional regulator with XRE-family HTH domain
MIGDNLKAAFNNKGLIVKEVARKSGISKGTIDNWVNKGKEPRINALYAVCKVVNITMEQTIEGEDELEYVRSLICDTSELHSGLSLESIKIARVAEHLSPEGRILALNQVEGLATLFPLEGSTSLSKTI